MSTPLHATWCLSRCFVLPLYFICRLHSLQITLVLSVFLNPLSASYKRKCRSRPISRKFLFVIHWPTKFLFFHLGWREKSLSNFWKNIFSLMVSSYFYSRHSPSLNLKLTSLRRCCCILLSLSLIILSSSLKLHDAAFIRNSVRNWSKGRHTCTPEFVRFCNLISTRIRKLFYFIKHISMLFFIFIFHTLKIKF